MKKCKRVEVTDFRMFVRACLAGQVCLLLVSSLQAGVLGRAPYGV